ncbi:MAG: GNAT family N-acetyltransferase [Rhodospirillales bacterium]|nr:GNAT family N-acetyltransferase [Rhodospirillales bacterium]
MAGRVQDGDGRPDEPDAVSDPRPGAIRAAEPADLGHILRLIRALAEYERLLDQVRITEADLARALFAPAPRAHALLAWAEDRPVGFALWYYTFSTFAGGPDLFLEDIFVDPSHRGAGLGLGLFRRLAAIARAEKCRRMEWRVLNWNEPSIRFYDRLGAKPMRDWTVMQLDGPALAALAAGEGHFHG